MKRTFQPKTRQMKKEAGRNVLKARRAKGRAKLSA